MALSTYLLVKTGDTGANVIDGIMSMLYTVDPALTPSDTAAERLALAMVKLAAVTGLEFPDGYFDVAEVLIGPSAGGVIALDDECIHFGLNGVVVTST
jgi:hypothetical protein